MTNPSPDQCYGATRPGESCPCAKCAAWRERVAETNRRNSTSSPDLHQPQVEAESVDTAELRELLSNYRAWPGPTAEPHAAIVAYFNGIISARVAAALAVHGCTSSDVDGQKAAEVSDNLAASQAAPAENCEIAINRNFPDHLRESVEVVAGPTFTYTDRETDEGCCTGCGRAVTYGTELTDPGIIHHAHNCIVLRAEALLSGQAAPAKAEGTASTDHLLKIIGYAYQVAGAHDAPDHILDVLADPEEATDEQVEAMLPYIPNTSQLLEFAQALVESCSKEIRGDTLCAHCHAQEGFSSERGGWEIQHKPDCIVLRAEALLSFTPAKEPT